MKSIVAKVGKLMLIGFLLIEIGLMGGLTPVSAEEGGYGRTITVGGIRV